MIVCAGTGCAYRVPIIYTEAMLNSVRLVMARATGTFEAENSRTVDKALFSYGARNLPFSKKNRD